MRINVFTVFIIVALLFTVASGQAQDHSFRLKGGLTMSNFAGEGFPGLKPGFQLGASAKLGGAEDLFFKSEFLITLKGSGTEEGDLSRDFTLLYLEIPLMFGLNVGRGFSINAGIQPGILLGGTMKSTRGGSEERRSIGKEIERFDYSLLLGVEYVLNETWMIGVRYNNSFVPLQEYHGELTRENGDNLLLNRTFQIYASYSIDKWFDKD